MPHPNRVGVSSGVLTGDTTVKSTPGEVFSITVNRGTTAPNNIVLRDGGAGGTIVWQALLEEQAAAGDVTDHFAFPAGLSCGTSIFLEIAGGTAVEVVVVYR